MLDITAKDGAVIVAVRVVPRASKSEIVGELDGFLKIRLSAPPVDGVANKELVKLLSKTFGVSKSQIEIISGETSKTKRVQIDGLNTKEFLKTINEL